MLITGPVYLVHPYDPEDRKNGFTVTNQGRVLAHTTTHESAMAAARLMCISEPFDTLDPEPIYDPSFLWPFAPDLGPTFKGNQ